MDILFRACTYPIMQIAENAGVDGSIVLEKVVHYYNTIVQ